MIIGKFTATKEGGWTGTVRTLAVNAKVGFLPDDNRSNERAPAFRVLAGHDFFPEMQSAIMRWEQHAQSLAQS